MGQRLLKKFDVFDKIFVFSEANNRTLAKIGTEVISTAVVENFIESELERLLNE